MKYLIVNADDFGQSEATNRGIIRAHREGILTSASLMVRWPAARHAVSNAGDIDLGLHIDLGEWAFRDGQWSAVYQRVSLDDAAAVDEEVQSQLDFFRQLTGTEPTHLDSHQHIHRCEPARTILRNLAAELGVPLRGNQQNRAPTFHYCGSFYGQSAEGQAYPQKISVESLVQSLHELPAGITELGCHPGEDTELKSAYRLERLHEVMTLCHPRVRETVIEEHIQLSTFRALAHLTFAPS